MHSSAMCCQIVGVDGLTRIHHLGSSPIRSLRNGPLRVETRTVSGVGVKVGPALGRRRLRPATHARHLGVAPRRGVEESASGAHPRPRLAPRWGVEDSAPATHACHLMNRAPSRGVDACAPSTLARLLRNRPRAWASKTPPQPPMAPSTRARHLTDREVIPGLFLPAPPQEGTSRPRACRRLRLPLRGSRRAGRMRTPDGG
jgi:hypothetical protein